MIILIIVQSVELESKDNPKACNLNCCLSSNQSINPESMGRV